MSFVPGAPDILTLVKLAYEIYDTFRSAPAHLKGLSEDIGGLRIVLKRLANRLALKEADSKVKSNSEECADLDHLVHQTAGLLKELEERSGARNALRGFRRFRWTQSEVNYLRSRITSLCSIIAAFNSNIALPNIDFMEPSVSQQQILDKLDDLLISIQQGSKDSQSVITFAEDDDEKTLCDGQDEMWENVVQELQNYGISEANALRHRPMIHKWAAKAAAAGILEEEVPLTAPVLGGPLLNSEALNEEFQVLGAVYGPQVVTDIVQRIFRSHIRHDLRQVSFTVANETFGGDPFIDCHKAFSMVWIKTTHTEYGTTYSAPQRIIAVEGEAIDIDLASQLPIHESLDEDQATIHILCATWHNKDVTEHVAQATRILSHSSIMASNYEFGEDVLFGNVKILSVIWAYCDTPPAITFCETKTAREGELLELPSRLILVHANFGTQDVTQFLRAKITADQTLHIDSHSLSQLAAHISKPASSPMSDSRYRRSLSILYRYGNEPFQLLVTGECASNLPATIAYDSNPRRGRFFFTSRNGPAAHMTILAAIWGLQPVSETTFLRALLDENRQILCTNEFFGTDGWPMVEKTCQIYLQSTSTGEITCVVEAEGHALSLLS